MSWVNLAEGVNIDFLEKLKPTERVLGFKQEGTIQHYKIMRIDKHNKKWWAKRITLYKPDEIDIIDKEQPDVS